MGFIAKLKRAGNELNLNDGSPFHLREGWIPPTVQLSANLAGGSSANRRQGASLVSSKAKNRNLTVPLAIEAASEAETRLALQGLISMLSHAGDEDSPLYFHFRPNDDVSFEPRWGQYGADYRYEVTFANRPALEDYPFESLQDGLLPSVNLVLNVKPYALGQRQRMAFAQGGILEDVIGAVDGVSRGTFLPEATINKMTNPIFGHSTFDNDWTAGANHTFTGDGTNTIADIIQELADSFDPSVIMLIGIYSSGTGERVIKSYDASPSTAPKLDLIFSAGGGSTQTATPSPVVIPIVVPALSPVIYPSPVVMPIVIPLPAVVGGGTIFPEPVVIPIAIPVPTITA
ncbi:MAG: hypothetical protein IID48_09745, partial [Proteobacteria bacterium]|nr:hypothetical protein [Pseudomonadota bacterium]